MIPILYEANETAFISYGIGPLTDAVDCTVYEQYNGEFELIMLYPVTGKLYEELAAERIIKAKAWDVRDPQLFRIYRITRPLRGIVTVYAQHISYDLAGKALDPFSGEYTPTGALAYLLTGTRYTGTSDKTGAKTVKTIEPKSIRAMLGGSEGSLLDLWGGEYTFDNFTISLKTKRGSDKGVVIEYGKNLTELTADNDLSEVYTELYPFAKYYDDSETERVVTAPRIPITSVISRGKTLTKDFTETLGLDPGKRPTVAQITAAANNWLSNNNLGYETPSITVSFEPAKGGANYPKVGLELGDTVTIRYTKLGVDVKARIVETEYDALAERYKKMVIGKPRANMANTVAALSDTIQTVQEYPTRWSDAIAVATRLITGNAGGYVVLHEGADGKPYEILIMDTPDIGTATNIWRWNLNGLGFSQNGYEGPYATAITYDGSINADFIKSGEINADLITAGCLRVLDANGNVLFEADQNNRVVTVAGFEVGATLFSKTTSVGPDEYTMDLSHYGLNLTKKTTNAGAVTNRVATIYDGRMTFRESSSTAQRGTDAIVSGGGVQFTKYNDDGTVDRQVSIGPGGASMGKGSINFSEGSINTPQPGTSQTITSAASIDQWGEADANNVSAVGNFNLTRWGNMVQVFIRFTTGAITAGAEALFFTPIAGRKPRGTIFCQTNQSAAPYAPPTNAAFWFNSSGELVGRAQPNTQYRVSAVYIVNQ